MRWLWTAVCSGDTHLAPSRHHGFGSPGKRPSGPESPASRPIPLDSCLLRRPHTRGGQGSTRSGVRTAACHQDARPRGSGPAPVRCSGTEDHLGTQDSSYASALVITALSQIRGAEGTSRVSTRNPARHTGPRAPGDADAEAVFPAGCRFISRTNSLKYRGFGPAFPSGALLFITR